MCCLSNKSLVRLFILPRKFFPFFLLPSSTSLFPSHYHPGQPLWGWLSHFTCVWLCVTLWTVANQVPLSMGVGCHFLLQGTFPTQGLNPGLLRCKQSLYQLSHRGSPPPQLMHRHLLQKLFWCPKYRLGSHLCYSYT